jgi:hypothetical protein
MEKGENLEDYGLAGNRGGPLAITPVDVVYYVITN